MKTQLKKYKTYISFFIFAFIPTGDVDFSCSAPSLLTIPNRIFIYSTCPFIFTNIPIHYFYGLLLSQFSLTLILHNISILFHYFVFSNMFKPSQSIFLSSVYYVAMHLLQDSYVLNFQFLFLIFINFPMLRYTNRS